MNDRERLRRWCVSLLLLVSAQALADEPTPTLDDALPPDVIVATTASGRPILPDLKAAHRARSRPREVPELTFTFSSPANPWTPQEETALRDAFATFYPIVKQLYGQPAFANTVNVRKDPAITSAGLYYPSTNEMVIRNADQLDVPIHEMIHAFHDDLLFGLQSWEEGMTRAAEVEAFARQTVYKHPWDAHHCYTYDVFFEALDTPAIGAARGTFYSGFTAVLLRYQLAGYAWAKPLLESKSFFYDFNDRYYPAAFRRPALRTDEAGLLALGAAVMPEVEGMKFTDWYAAQAILRTNPPVGYHLYQRVNQYTVDYFLRSEKGAELMQGNVPVDWAVLDHTGARLDSGTIVTKSNGLESFYPKLPSGYLGRVEVVVSAPSPGGRVESRYLRTAAEGTGVFGVVVGADSGEVTITPIDDPAAAVTVPVVDGAFYAPPLQALAGRFLARFAGPGGTISSLRFNKDASSYYIALSLTGVCGDGAVARGEGCDDGNLVSGDGCSASCVSER